MLSTVLGTRTAKMNKTLFPPLRRVKSSGAGDTHTTDPKGSEMSANTEICVQQGHPAQKWRGQGRQPSKRDAWHVLRLDRS